MSNRLKKSFYSYQAKLLFCFLCINHSYAIPELHALTDDELSDTRGQALLNLSYLAPGESVDPTNVNGGVIGFYRLGMEAEIELNANIKKLQLGCGGVNGPGACDIDIDNLSLSGNSSTRDGRASSSAKITNPFIEFAIKNPGSAATREIVGFRSSAEKIVGLLTTGTENSTAPNGINTLSGFMRVQSDSSGYIYGKAKTGASRFDAGANPISGDLQITGLGGLATVSFITNGGGFNIPAMQNIPFIRAGKVVNGNRISSLPLQATLNVPSIKVGWRNSDKSENPNYPINGVTEYYNPVESPIDWSFNVPKEVRSQGGFVAAQVTGCSSPLGGLVCGPVSLIAPDGKQLNNIFMQGQITGLTAIANIQQGLGYIHNLPINGTSGGYLSLQKQDLRWPGSYSGPDPENPSQTVIDIAKRGWWLSMADPINLGSRVLS